MKTNEIITCVNRFNKGCPKCTPDYNPNHHPNNKECPGYCEVRVRTFEVVNKGSYAQETRGVLG